MKCMRAFFTPHHAAAQKPPKMSGEYTPKWTPMKVSHSMRSSRGALCRPPRAPRCVTVIQSWCAFQMIGGMEKSAKTASIA